MDVLKVIDIKNNKIYKLLPPYNLDHRLLTNPCFTTTHVNDFTMSKRNKYTNIKSKYKIQI